MELLRDTAIKVEYRSRSSSSTYRVFLISILHAGEIASGVGELSQKETKLVNEGERVGEAFSCLIAS